MPGPWGGLFDVKRGYNWMVVTFFGERRFYSARIEEPRFIRKTKVEEACIVFTKIAWVSNYLFKAHGASYVLEHISIYLRGVWIMVPFVAMCVKIASDK